MPAYQPYVSKDFCIAGSFLRLDSVENAWNALDGRMRTSIRKAETSGVSIEKAPNTQQSVEEFLPFCLNPDDIPAKLTERYHLYLAKIEKKTVAAILVVEVKNKLFMLCHASTPEAKTLQIPSLLIWHVVKQFAGGKFRVFDIGASYRPNLQKFFSGWQSARYPMIMKPPELKPTLLLTPFDTEALGKEPEPEGEVKSRKMIDEKAQGKPWTFFPRAMYGLYTIIKHLKNEEKIQEEDTVWISTTNENHYISSCVTSAIEQTCPWTRTLSDKTKAIVVIHEFGFLHPQLQELRKIADERGIPLIEDCAYAFGTKGAGITGDYILYSLTKTFPVQFGGILVGKNFTHEELWKGFGCSDKGKEEYTFRMLSPWIIDVNNIRTERQKNYAWYQSVFGEDRCYFLQQDGTEPGAFLLKMNDEEEMKTVSEFVRSFGIECGNYWKNSAIILPVHQRLRPAHLDYIAGAVLATEREWCGVPYPPHGLNHH